MNLFFITDVHGDIGLLKEFLDKLPDNAVIAIGGDIVGQSIKKEKLYYEFCDIQMKLRTVINDEQENVFPFEYAKLVLNGDKDKKYKSIAKRYIKLVKKAENDMKAFYERIARILKEHNNKQFLIVPGNYDLDLSDTALSDWDLHKKVKKIEEVKFAGFGGADNFTPGVPDILRVEYPGENHAIQDFIIKEKPDIVVVHNPPFGIHDTMAFGSVGSVQLRNVLEDRDLPTKLVLSGHIHDAQGVKKIYRRIYINPSIFGRTAFGDNYGNFAEVIIQGKEIISAKIKSLKKDKVLV